MRPVAWPSIRRLSLPMIAVLAVVACAESPAGTSSPAPSDGVARVAVATGPPALPGVGGPPADGGAATPVATLAPSRSAPPRAADPRTPSTPAPDACADGDLRAPPATDPALTVVDRSHALRPDAVPPDLVPASTAGITGRSGKMLVRRVVVADLAAMRSAWTKEGVTLFIESSYRSYESQARTLKTWIERIGTAAALERVARPGHSEHQLGTAFDFTSPGWSGRVGDWAVDSDAGRWMAAHAWEYGFAMSYGSRSKAKDCYAYEPWHYRWIGREAAARHQASGLTLREYLVGLVPGASGRNR